MKLQECAILCICSDRNPRILQNFQEGDSPHSTKWIIILTILWCSSRPFLVFSKVTPPPKEAGLLGQQRVVVWLHGSLQLPSFSVRSRDLLNCQPSHSSLRLPSDWVSYLHGCCLQADCWFWKPPQKIILFYWGWYIFYADSSIICPLNFLPSLIVSDK